MLTGRLLCTEGCGIRSQLLQLTHAANEDLSIGLVALQQSVPTQGVPACGLHECHQDADVNCSVHALTLILLRPVWAAQTE